MNFDSGKGTRGARQPKGRFFRWVNTVMARRPGMPGDPGDPDDPGAPVSPICTPPTR